MALAIVTRACRDRVTRAALAYRERCTRAFSRTIGVTTMRPFYNFENPAQLTSYLRATLIPDLRDSGSDATADDFSDCATHIENMSEPVQQRATPRYAVSGVTVYDGDTDYQYVCSTAAQAAHLARELNK